MKPFARAPLSIVLLIFCFCSLAEAEESKHFYFGARLGTTNDVEVSNRTDTITMEENGVNGGAFVGLLFNENWSAEIGYSKLENTDLVFIEGNDIDITATHVALAYTYRADGKKFFVRGKAGVSYWRASVEENFVFFFIDIVDDEEAITYENTGSSPLLAAETGFRFNPTFEWIAVGFESTLGGDATWNTIYSGIKLNF